jgi:excisionase family DNA binding protein
MANLANKILIKGDEKAIMQNQDAEDEILTVAEVAERLRKHYKTVLLWIRKGKLPAMKAGEHGHYMIKSKDLEALKYNPRHKE